MPWWEVKIQEGRQKNLEEKQGEGARGRKKGTTGERM